MNIRYFAFAALLSSVAAFAQNPVTVDSSFQIRYASNLAIGDSVVNLTNSGANGAPDIGGEAAGTGNICANVYAYSPDEQLVSCCSCTVTPNGLNSLSVKNDLASNTLTPIIPSALVIKLLATAGTCTASSAATAGATANPLVKAGMLAWGTTLHAAPAGGTFGTETAFSPATLSAGELSRMTQLCAFIRANGSGYGICKSCKVGGLGASAK